MSERVEDIKSEEDDYIQKTIGEFGKWQLLVCIYAGLTRITAMWNMMSIVFLTPTTSFICNKTSGNTTEQFSINRCYRDCVEYVYFENEMESSLTSDFGLVCARAWLGSLTQTVLMFGLLLGVWLFGWISDRYGRRTALLLSTGINVIFMIVAPLSPNYWTFTLIRFVVGLASGGTLIIGVVYILEVVGNKYTEVAGALAVFPDGFDEMLLSVFAYFTRSWRMYLFIYAIISVVFLVLVAFLPESPRWLITHGRTEDAIELMITAAEKNKRKTRHIRNYIMNIGKNIHTKQGSSSKKNYGDLFQTKELTVKSIASFLVWTVTGLCFFGINQYVTFLGSNLFLTVILLGLISVPSSFISLMLNKIFGRRKTTMIGLCGTGVAMIALTIIPRSNWTDIVFGIGGFCMAGTTFVVIYTYTVELFPTPIRNMAYGLCSGGAKIGAMIAPFVAAIHPQWVPSLVFAILPLLCAAVCLILPETRGKKLEDTLN